MSGTKKNSNQVFFLAAKTEPEIHINQKLRGPETDHTIITARANACDLFNAVWFYRVLTSNCKKTLVNDMEWKNLLGAYRKGGEKLETS